MASSARGHGHVGPSSSNRLPPPPARRRPSRASPVCADAADAVPQLLLLLRWIPELFALLAAFSGSGCSTACRWSSIFEVGASHAAAAAVEQELDPLAVADGPFAVSCRRRRQIRLSA